MKTRITSLWINTNSIIPFLFLTLSVFLFINPINAQHQACGSEEYLQHQMMNDVNLKNRMDLIKHQTLQKTAPSSAYRTSSSVLTIPVVVHVVYNTSAQNISDAQIQSQIDVLNQDFNKTNADTVNTPSVFKPYAASANIQFVLAKQDPNGNATSGITRTATSNTVFTTNSYVKFDTYGGKNAWNTTQYLNLWVCNLSGCAGYAAMPGASASVDGVVINYMCFGTTGALMSTTTKGRTATHEVAHWLGLAHIWGPSGTCGDDAMADTPTQEKANSGVPAFPHVSACSPNSNGDMFMNYMDYSDDVARNMFTINQVNYMNATLSGYRSSLLTSLGSVAPGTSTTTTVACSIPNGLNTTSVTSSSATLNWLSTDATSYNVKYKAISSTTWINGSSSSTSFSISGLNASTGYEFQVASVCSGTTSAYSTSSTFTTAATTTTSPIVTIGASNTLQSANPYGTSFVKEHTQFIITKSELVSAGYNNINNVIKSLSFYVTTASSQTMSGYTIKISHITTTDFTNSNFIATSNATTVYSSNFATTSNDWNKHLFSTGFNYNGVDNLLIDISWNNTTTSTNSSVYSTNTSTYRTLYYSTTNKKTTLSKVTSGTLTYSRPNMQFEFSAPMAARIGNEVASSTISDKKLEANLYPNPATTQLNIALTNIEKETNVLISIYDIAGALVVNFNQVIDPVNNKVFSINFDEVDSFQNLKTGIYICSIETENQKTVQKFILNK